MLQTNRFKEEDTLKKEYTLKTIILGDSGVGKSTLLYKYYNNKYSDDITSTIGINYISKNVDIFDDKNVKIQIWDTAGQERFRSIISTYYRNVAGCILAYDITNLESFHNCSYWLNEIASKNKYVKVYLVGTKLDLDEKRQVPYKLASKFAEERNIPFYEISSKNEVDFVFILFIKSILNGYINSNHIVGVMERSVSPPPPARSNYMYKCCL